ncbi:glycoside hydrolase family 65 protein [Schleiferilactobacillus perolens]|uniref:Glycosyl hydrolase n=1 Tax=Schleiferilactobacillus perolens DSM 12744 TaxID=1423792 RepID=A0A0R1MPQ1_9LACO|nr:glycosyl hydrolase family 65 protein [Schleiferilactobacillus perolens]KRL10006.1 glycosyl hydrolase [Schleiferilactobacillus perolens DSM 12744]
MATIKLTVEPAAILLHGEQGDRSIQYTAAESSAAIGQRLNRELQALGATAVALRTPTASRFSTTIIELAGKKVDLATLITDQTNIPVYGQRGHGATTMEDAVALAGHHLTYYGVFGGPENYAQETLLTLGNGFIGLRGAYLSVDANQDNYPGFYAAGLFDQQTTKIAGHNVENEDLVNLPNAQFLQVSVDGVPIDPQSAKLIDVYRDLDMQKGTMTLQTIIALSNGRHLDVKAEKVVDMVQWHHYAVRMTVTPLDFTGTITISSKLDGSIQNRNVARYQAFKSNHFDIQKLAVQGPDATLLAETKSSQVDFVVATRLHGADEWAGQADGDVAWQKSSRKLAAGESWTVTKDVVLFTSLESVNLETQADRLLAVASYDTARDNAASVWHRIWQTADIEITGDITSQKLVQLNIFHTYVTASPLANPHLDASVGARGLHGEGYRGHIFWDELFVLPFYTDHNPLLAKSLLAYRYRRLGAARQNAAQAHYQGAMYPWQSGMVGDEQTPALRLNPITQQWETDNSYRQRHVSLAVAYNVWYYFHTTQDILFMRDQGVEMLLSIAKFWISAAQLNPQTGYYDITGVMGPDEFHEGVPGKPAGLTNNTYTNVMVVWLFAMLATLQSQLPEDLWQASAARVDFTKEDQQLARDIANKMALNVSPEGIIAQFQGYFDLQPVDLAAYGEKYGDVHRLDRILKAKGDSPDAYQIAKQADALMAFWNLPVATVTDIFSDLGHELPADFMKQNLAYWLARTTHGSTLSRVVYSALAVQDHQPELAWQLFSAALFSDYRDIQGGTTAEGIHLGVMAATLTVVQRDFAGIDDRGEHLTIDPHLPEHWQSIHFNRLYQGIRVDFLVTKAAVTITADRPLTIYIQGQPKNIPASTPQTIKF